VLGVFFSRWVACAVGMYIGGVGATARAWICASPGRG
jgi:hypothetical protein